MSICRPDRAAFAVGLFLAVSPLAQAQEADIVLTPGRSPQAISRSGSAVTVIRAEEIAKAAVKSTADLFRDIPGVAITENGGPGQAATLRIRGAEARHTLVLIDGIRVNDPSTGASEFDLNALVPTDIERIEVLRGPQSALYGSDAVGGVVNIITRKGRGGYHGFASIEAGSYGTLESRTGISGGSKDFDYALSLSAGRANGFSAWGYRIGRLAAMQPGKLEADGYRRLGGSAKFSWRPVEGLEIETGLSSSFNRARYDAAYGALPDTPSMATARLTTGYLKASLDTLDNRLKHTLTVSGTHSSRNYNDLSYFDFGFGLMREWDKFDYVGKRFGVEYQGDLKLDRYGTLSFGLGLSEESLATRIRPVETMWMSADSMHARQQTRSAFLLYQLPVGERLDLSFGGRLDDVHNADRFATWRITGAYRISETGTKFRASLGTGGKAPSLFQLYSPQYGTRTLETEHSLGIDAGIDQSLLNGRLTLSLSGFHNRLSNLIDYSPIDPKSFTYPICPSAQLYTGCYLNIAKAQTSGAELSADAVLIEGLLKARASYTHLKARDLVSGLHLPRRPEHQGSLSFTWTPLEALTIQPSLRLVGARYSSANEVYKLAPYARFDLRADYQVHKSLNLYVRAENLTNARYQEVYNYGSTGRAVYAGLKASW